MLRTLLGMSLATYTPLSCPGSGRGHCFMTFGCYPSLHRWMELTLTQSVSSQLHHIWLTVYVLYMLLLVNGWGSGPSDTTNLNIPATGWQEACPVFTGDLRGLMTRRTEQNAQIQAC